MIEQTVSTFGRLDAAYNDAGVQSPAVGDVVWIPPGEEHWHGATASTAMTHIVIQEQLDGKVADWIEKVTDEQYQS